MSHDCTLPTPGLFTTTLVCRDRSCRRVWVFTRQRVSTPHGDGIGIATPTTQHQTGRRTR